MKKTNNWEKKQKQTGSGLGCLDLAGRFSLQQQMEGWASLCWVFFMFVSPPLHFSCLLQQRLVVRTGVGLSPSLVFPPIKEMTWTKGWKSYAEGGK